jgi:hypothetical protein
MEKVKSIDVLIEYNKMHYEGYYDTGNKYHGDFIIKHKDDDNKIYIGYFINDFLKYMRLIYGVKK